MSSPNFDKFAKSRMCSFWFVIKVFKNSRKLPKKPTNNQRLMTTFCFADVFLSSSLNLLFSPTVLLVVGYPTPSEGWRKTIEPQKPGNSPRSGPEVVQRQRVAKEWAVQRVRSWTVQNEISGVLGRVSTGAAGRILDSANPREVRT